MDVSLDTSELDAMAAMLTAAGPKVEREAGETVADAADRVMDDARSAAPVLTGELRQSISQSGSGLERVVSAGVPYAIYVEFGTSVMPPQPFMFPAARVAERELPEKFEKLGDPFA